MLGAASSRLSEAAPMQDFRGDFQVAFATALLDPDLPPPASVVSHLSTSPRGRFAVYRNNVMVALVGALETRFAATRRIVGEEFFAAMARVFAATNPPRSPLMMVYGDDFPSFIEGFEPVAAVPYLADVARLEAARTRAYHAADAEPLTQEILATALQDRAETLGFILHPSVEIVTSPFPIVTIWAMNAGETELAPVEDWSGEDALVLRPGLDALVTRLPRGGAGFLEALRRGAPLGAAVETAHAATPGFDIAENLAILLGAGLVVGWRRVG
jgi:hypothetical protein